LYKHDIGYELTTQLLVDAEVGRPMVPIQMHWKTLDGEYSPAKTAPSAEEHRLEQIMSLMQSAAAMHLSAQIVHALFVYLDEILDSRAWVGLDCYFVQRQASLALW
jgi:hypothetical protein